MENLSDRQKQVLFHIINAYMTSFHPIGSRTLTTKHNMKYSAATIRNDMCDLEELGFIMHPHVSAGRIPTDKGYRYYVYYLLQGSEIAPDTIQQVKDVFKNNLANIEDLIEKTSQIVSAISEETCIGVLFRPQSLLLKQLNLIALDERKVLAIWVTTSGLVRNKIHELDEDVSPEYLTKIANFLNEELIGMPLEDVEQYIKEKLALERDSLRNVYMWAKKIVADTLPLLASDVAICLEGRKHIFGKPEFSDMDRTKKLFALFEDRKELIDILNCDNYPMQINVRIGKENKCHDLWDCSLISATYRLRNRAIGNINVIGPTRLNYGRVISLLKYISHMVTEKVHELEIRD